MLLFICHVSEDKADFVQPLAEALRAHFDVWYDDFQLRLGDNLLQKINEGLVAADFAVVVLSKAFFAKKKWAESELGGLFALETATRKIILPIWKDVTEADVKAYSPILANKLAVSASEGLPKVIEEIRLAVGVAQRKDEIGINSTTAKVKALAQTLEQRKESDRLARSEEGAALVDQSVESLYKEIQRLLTEGAGGSEVLKFGFGRPMKHILYVNTVKGMYLGLGVSGLSSNYVADASLQAKIFKRQFGAFGEPHGDGLDIEELQFKPRFRSGEVVWIQHDDNNNGFRTSQLAAHLIEIFIAHVIEQTGIP